MMTEKNIMQRYQSFAKVAAPYLDIADHAQYHRTLTMIEDCLDRAEDQGHDPLNGLIDLLSRAIERYESQQDDLENFDAQAHEGAADVAALRFIMDQHGLSGADFPEIGDKSLISRILSGSRRLTKLHIEKLSERFQLNPACFF